MNYIQQNLKFLRKQRNMTQQDFSELLNIKRSSLGAYEEGRANPGWELLAEITTRFGISLDQLVKENLAESSRQMLNKDYDQQVKATDISGKKTRILSITVDSQDREYIDLVPQKAAAGYLTGYSDPFFVEELPKFKMPNLPQGTYRAFEITGDSMLPLHPGTIVIGEYLLDWHEIKDGHTYIVVSEKEGVVYKRVFNRVEEENKLILKSDNPSYPPYSIPAIEILEVWKAKAFISTIFPDQQVSVDKLMNIVMDLQQEVIKLKNSG